MDETRHFQRKGSKLGGKLVRTERMRGMCQVKERGAMRWRFRGVEAGHNGGDVSISFLEFLRDEEGKD